MPEPEYDFVQNFVCLTIRFKQPLTPHLTDHGELNGSLNGALNGELNEALKGLGATVIATYEIIKGNPGIQRKSGSGGQELLYSLNVHEMKCA